MATVVLLDGTRITNSLQDMVRLQTLVEKHISLVADGNQGTVHSMARLLNGHIRGAAIEELEALVSEVFWYRRFPPVLSEDKTPDLSDAITRISQAKPEQRCNVLNGMFPNVEDRTELLSSLLAKALEG